MSDEVMRLSNGVCRVRAARMERGGSQLLYSPGVCREMSGARRLAFCLLTVPPGGAARPHYHLAGETVIYILQGQAETRFGQRLAQSVSTGPGDFLFIPANTPHAPRNLSESEAGVALNARTHPAQQEPLVPVDPARDAPIALDPRGVQKLGEGSTQPLHLSVWRLLLGPHSDQPPQQDAAAEIAAYAGTDGVALRCGDDLQEDLECAAGDFVFVPDGVRHQWHNTRQRESWLVIARSTQPPLDA